MAKLGAYYGLCPLIDQKNLLGVTEDVEPGHVIVTLGRNIAIKYRLSDQKQIHSWRTKDKFSSPVIYDRISDQYVAVFNQIHLRMWKGDEEYVDKLKKYKFNKSIFTLATCNNKSFVVFKNGSVVPLIDAIENRKDKDVNESINITNTTDKLTVLTAILKDDIYIGLLLQQTQVVKLLLTVFNENNKNEYTIELARENNAILMGQVLCQIENQTGITLFTLWSDGKIYTYPLKNLFEIELTNELEKPPGTLFSKIELLSCKYPVTIEYLNNHYIALYGADYSEEGASLILYNTQFKVSQSKQPLKLFTSESKLWKLENNLLICVGQNLAVIPYYLDTEQLASLVGSHRLALNELDPDITIVEKLEVVNWGPTRITLTNNCIPKKIQSKMAEFSEQGLSEATICEKMLPELMEAKNIDAILCCLQYFCDIPEFYIAKLLRFCLTTDAKYFKNLKPNLLQSKPNNIQLREKHVFLDKLLTRSFSDILLFPIIRSELDLDCTLSLLEYIGYLMSEDGHSLSDKDGFESENKLIDWICLLLDANYQKLLLTKDPTVLTLLKQFKKIVEENLALLKRFGNVVPLLSEFQKRKELQRIYKLIIYIIQ